MITEEEAKRELSKIYKLDKPEDFIKLKEKLLKETADDQKENIS